MIKATVKYEESTIESERTRSWILWDRTSLVKEFDSFFLWNCSEQPRRASTVDCKKVRESADSYFRRKGVKEGHPAALQQEYLDRKRKEVVLKGRLSLEKSSILKRGITMGKNRVNFA